MLLEFIFKNAFSYRNEAYFSMEAEGRTRVKNEFPKFQNHRILKSAAIFGANASGKSNLSESLRTFQRLIIKPDNVSIPFPSFAGHKENPIEFCITIIKNEKIYRYSVSYLPKKILQEHLEIELANGTFKTYFERKGTEYSSLPKKLNILIDKTRSDNLFLNTAKTFNDEHCLAVFRWFMEDLIILDSQINLNQRLLKNLENKNHKENVLFFMKSADINIEDIEVQEQPSSFYNTFKDMLGEVNEKLEISKTELRLRIKHRQYNDLDERIDDFVLDFNQESIGTQKLLYLALIILLNKNSVIFIDEFDTSLHIELARALLELFNSEENSNQFILTTHELSLMDSDFKREQIYFAERRENGVSDLFSAYDFDSETNRKDYSYLKRYLQGKFGAVPIIIVDSMKEALRYRGK
ncbi:MAG: ATP-binding protein [Streptococcaceae bacterium]|jgi:AAA15 family ATPase/GTPase|nr:ATP-binding protein [Streptococcaceae bacterium]